MSATEIQHPQRVIDELSRFIRKVLNEPEICNIAKDIARKHLNDDNANQVIGEELSSSTSVKIPLEHSEADDLFLELLKDVVRDEQALY